MPDKLIEIAGRIRELRELSDIDESSMAEYLDISLQQYSLYESGQADIPVSLLYRIANKFNIELTTILTGENPKLHVYSLVRGGKGVTVERREQYNYQNLAFNFIHKKAEPFLVTVEPSESDKELSYNSHPGQEFNYVLEGTLMVIIDNHELTLNAGDSLFFDSNYKHAMKALDNKTAKFLAIIF